MKFHFICNFTRTEAPIPTIHVHTSPSPGYRSPVYRSFNNKFTIGVPVGWIVVQYSRNFFRSPKLNASFTTAAIAQKASSGLASLQVLGVTPGSGERLARDRDQDGVLNGAEAPTSYGAASLGCNGAPTLRAMSNAVPRSVSMLRCVPHAIWRHTAGCSASSAFHTA